MNREIVVVIGWGRAVLLQLAHPLIATAVAEHSTFRRDFFGYMNRTRHTIDAMLGLTFGPPGRAQASANAINAIHDRVSGQLHTHAGAFAAGTRYSAHDPELLRWVHATLLESIPLAYETFVGSLTPDEQDRYCLESTEMESHLHMPRGTLPRTRHDADAYLRDMLASDTIRVTPTARELARTLLSPQLGPAAPLFRPIRLFTIGTLPPAIRDAYEFPWDARQQASLDRWIRTVRTARRWSPRIVREWPRARRTSSQSSQLIK